MIFRLHLECLGLIVMKITLGLFFFFQVPSVRLATSCLRSAVPVPACTAERAPKDGTDTSVIAPGQASRGRHVGNVSCSSHRHIRHYYYLLLLLLLLIISISLLVLLLLLILLFQSTLRTLLNLVLIS